MKISTRDLKILINRVLNSNPRGKDNAVAIEITIEILVAEARAKAKAILE